MKNARAERAKLLLLPTKYIKFVTFSLPWPLSLQTWWLLLMFGELKDFPLRLLASLAELYYSFPGNQGCDLSSNCPFQLFCYLGL